jgi:ATP-dependent Clp protease ATP-binding subunit ClpA
MLQTIGAILMGQMQSNIDKLKGLYGHLLNEIKGQEHLIGKVCSVLTRGELGLQNSGRPKGSFLFIGPTGTGKTELALKFTDYLFGQNHFRRFDMSEFQTQEAIHILLGKTYQESGLLGQILEAQEGGTLLFDEMEKAHPQVLDLFLQILDAGRITTADGVTRCLNRFYIVFTSNIGAKDAMRMVHAPFSSVENTIMLQVNQQLRPEMVARINEKLVFKRLDYEILREICELMIGKELKRLGELGYELTIEESAKEFLVRRGFHKDLGARPMRDAIEKHIQDALCQIIFREDFFKGTITVCKDTDRVVIR